MSHAMLIVLVSAVVTALLHFLPFWLFGGKRPTPPLVVRLGQVLPPAMMAMLVIYCLRNVSFASPARFLPELIACLVTAGSYALRRSSLLSIVSGTVCYMLLVQLVF